MATLCALVGGFVFASAPALAAGPPAIVEESVLNVASTSATLQAEIDPEGAETTYRFEYGTSDAYGESVPVSGGATGSGTSAVTVQAHPQDLQAGTTYHFRVVATNGKGTEEGADQVFSTQRAGGALTLLDGREWEMVSPPNKQGSGLEPPPSEGGLVEASSEGGAITYLANGPVTGEPKGNRAPESIQALSRRDTNGWQTEDISTPNDSAGSFSGGAIAEYRLFSPDLSVSLLNPPGNTLLSPQATERTPYLRDDSTGEYVPLVSAADVLPGTKFGGNPEFPFGDVDAVGASPDLSHVVLKSRVPLLEGAVGGELYEWGAEKLQLVSAPSKFGESPRGEVLGNDNDIRNAVSADGSRMVLTAQYNQGESLYLRDMVKHETIRLDVVQPGASGEGKEEPEFQIASSDGSKVFFTDDQRLTPDSRATVGGGEPDLYECEIGEVEGRLVCTLSDLTVPQNPGEAGDMRGVVLGASEDGSYLYFVAEGVLASGATSGAFNLYESHDGRTTYIASLSEEDVYRMSLFATGLRHLTARVSANGRYLAFMSERDLAGYDNHDALSGAPDEEVYLYDATSSRLVCVSCDPTGARPDGVYDPGGEPGQLLVDRVAIWEGRWLAGSLPGWSPADVQVAPYQPRFLTDSGRLFFDSADALVPQDTNGVEDVYEYEPAGVGGSSGCTAGGALYEEAAGGCVGLVSSGTAAEESALLDASESGDDVFFLTSGRLVHGDVDDALDVYDAHVCSSAVPCPGGVVSPPACTTADSCRPAVSPQPAVFGAPASATLAATGNVVAGAPSSMPVKGGSKAKTKSGPGKKHREKHRGKRRGRRGGKSRGRAIRSGRRRAGR